MALRAIKRNPMVSRLLHNPIFVGAIFTIIAILVVLGIGLAIKA